MLKITQDLQKYLTADGKAQDDYLGGVTLIDDTGFAYRYVAQSGDSMMRIKDQETIEGTIRFLGKVRDDANSLTLTFNPEDEDDDTSSPRFKFENLEIPW